jgi:hypothetical protein
VWRCRASSGVSGVVGNNDEALASSDVELRSDTAPRIISKAGAKLLGEPTFVKCFAITLTLLRPIVPGRAKTVSAMDEMKPEELLSVELKADRKLGLRLRNAMEKVATPRFIPDGYACDGKGRHLKELRTRESRRNDRVDFGKRDGSCISIDRHQNGRVATSNDPKLSRPRRAEEGRE